MAIKKVTLREFKSLVKEIIREERLYSDLTKDQVDSHKELKQNISKFLDKQGIKNYKIMPDGTVNVDGDVVLNLPNNATIMPFKFGTVLGNFTLNGGKINNLKGSPKYVGGNFVVKSPIKNLIGSPVEVGGDFIAGNNDNLTSLAGAPKEVGGNFDVAFTSIKSLEGAPIKVGGDFEVYVEKYDFSNLIGSPEYVGGNYSVCNVKSLEGLNRVNGHLDVFKTDLFYLKRLGNKQEGDNVDEIFYQMEFKDKSNYEYIKGVRGKIEASEYELSEYHNVPYENIIPLSRD